MDSNNNLPKNIDYYCTCFKNLKTDKSRGVAPHQPLLLLSIIELITQGIIKENKFFISDELTKTFNEYWDIVPSDYTCRYKKGLYLPFYHLRKSPFWHLTYHQQYMEEQPKKIKSYKQLREVVKYAQLDQELFNFIKSENSRNELIDTLMSMWFDSSKKELEDIVIFNDNFEDKIIQEIEESQKIYLRKSVLRNASFRKAIVHIYEYKCAFCHLSVTHSFKQSIVDAAHIKPLAQFYDSNINNGLSLCKNHHWAFDNGLFTIDDNYKIIISSHFKEYSPNCRSMREFNGEQLLLPKFNLHYPRIDAIQWHRSNIFRT